MPMADIDKCYEEREKKVRVPHERVNSWFEKSDENEKWTVGFFSYFLTKW